MKNNTIIQTIYKKLEEKEWSILKTFILSEDFDSIIDKLIIEVNDENRFTPPFKTMFNSFLQCPYDKLKVVILGEFPFRNHVVCDGLAYSHVEKSKINYAENKHMVKLFSNTSCSLENLANKGILFLNNPLTTRLENDSETHKKIWFPFIMFLLDMLRNNYLWILVGHNQNYKKLIKSDDIILLDKIEDLSETDVIKINKLI